MNTIRRNEQNHLNRIMGKRTCGDGPVATYSQTPAPFSCLVFMILFPMILSQSAAAQTQEFRHRVTGLFQHDRTNDLQKLIVQIPDVKLLSVDFSSAEAVFSYDASKLGGGKPEKALERLDNLVRTASRSTFGIKPACTTPRDQLTSVEISVLGLDCKGCALSAYEAVAKIDGMEQATASFKTGRINAMIDGTKTKRESLVEALKKARVEVAEKP